MRKTVWVACVIALAAGPLTAQSPFKPDHAKANIGGLQGLMFVSSVQTGSGEWVPARLPGCEVYLAPLKALHEHLSFPCNEWFLPSAEGSYLVWLATKDAVSANQTVLMERPVPYQGFGSVAIHGLQPAGFVTVDVPVPPGHTVRFVHLDAPGLGFSLRASARDAGKRFPMPPGRVVAGIFDAKGDAVAHHRPSIVKAGETTAFRIVPPDRGADLLVILNKPQGHRDGPPVDVVLQGAAPKAPDVLLEQRSYVVAIWYGLPDHRVTVSATSSKLQLKRDLDLRPRAVSTLRADLTVKEEKR
jgi:hypothetical protein